MEIRIQVPKAFSVRDEHEFFPFQHAMARLNPQLRVIPVATGVHVSGGCTVFWGLIYAVGQKVTQQEITAALQEAGFDLQHNGPIRKVDVNAPEPAIA
jgi:hypothetical protein